MPRVECSIVISQPIDKVFTYTTTPANYINWQPWVLDSQSEHRVSIGTRIEVLGQLMGRRVDMSTEVIEFVPNKRLVSQGGPKSFFSRVVYKFEREDGGTRINYTADFQPKGFILGLFGSLVVSRFRNQVKDSFERLKGVLEAEF